MIIMQNECSACHHILFKLADKMQTSESDASDLLSEILTHDAELNDLFIEMVENIHMKQRMMAVAFSIKNRQAKDKYIDSNFRNTLSELSSDLINYGSAIVLRKLLISSIALGIAQNIGIDYHAATEELYYYMRKNEAQTHESLIT
jgi:cobalamin biosynthesis protein CbiD